MCVSEDRTGQRTRRALRRRPTDGLPGLLRDPRRPADRDAGRHQEGLPQARPRAPPGPEPRRQGRRAAVQGRQRGERRPVRPGEAQAVRPARRELGPVPARRRRPAAAPTRSGRAARSRGSAPGRPAARAGRRTGGVRYEFRTPGGDAGFSDFFRMFFSGATAGAHGDDRPRRARPSRASPASTSRRSSADEHRPGRRRRDRQRSASGGRRSGATGGARPASRGEVEAPAEISLEEAFHGTSRVVDVDGRRSRSSSRAASTPAAGSACRARARTARTSSSP